MEIVNECYVSVAYKLTVDGNLVDASRDDQPLGFIFGCGMLLPKFEENILGKVVGDKVAFTLQPEDGYGVSVAEAIVDLPRSIFEIEGKFDEEMVKVGAVLPMMDNQGNQMPGKVLEVGAETIKLDFNHPLAGAVLNFEVEVMEVREATDADMAQFMPQQGGCSSCGCEGGDCGDGCEGGKCCE